MGDAASRVGRINENGSIGIIDKECRMIALHIDDAIVKVWCFCPTFAASSSENELAFCKQRV